MRGSRNFRQGGAGPGQSDKKSSDVFFFFFCFFFIPIPADRFRQDQAHRIIIAIMSAKVSIANHDIPGRVAQLVTCLATDVCLTADPGVAGSIPAWSHTFLEIDHKIVSTILLPSAYSFKKGCCQLQAKVCARITG